MLAKKRSVLIISILLAISMLFSSVFSFANVSEELSGNDAVQKNEIIDMETGESENTAGEEKEKTAGEEGGETTSEKSEEAANKEREKTANKEGVGENEEESNKPVDYEWICSDCGNVNHTEKCTECGKISNVPQVLILSKTKQNFRMSINHPDSGNIYRYGIIMNGSIGGKKIYASRSNGILKKDNIFRATLSPSSQFEITVFGVNKYYKPCTDKIVIDFQMDGLSKYKVLTLTQAKKNAKAAYEAGKKSYTFAVYGGMSGSSVRKSLKSYINSGKWRIYNKFFGKISKITPKGKSIYYPERYRYNGERFTIYTVYFHHELSAAKNKRLRARLQKNVKNLKLSKNTTKTKVKKITIFQQKNRRYKRIKAKHIYEMVFSGRGHCQHFSWEFAIMCNLAGVKAEYVSGLTHRNRFHAWNQVKVGKKWYNHDVTWIKTRGDYSKWCFKGSGSSSFNRTHKLNPKYYTTPTWKKDHPLSRTSLKW